MYVCSTNTYYKTRQLLKLINKDVNKFLYQIFIRRCGAASDYKTRWLWVRCPLDSIRFFFSFLHSDRQAHLFVEFPHLPRNISKIEQKKGNGVS